jgi:hypothetical protein
VQLGTTTGHSDGDVIKPNPVLVEPIFNGRAGQRCTQNQPRVSLPDAVAELPKVREILVEVELR